MDKACIATNEDFPDIVRLLRPLTLIGDTKSRKNGFQTKTGLLCRLYEKVYLCNFVHVSPLTVFSYLTFSGGLLCHLFLVLSFKSLVVQRLFHKSKLSGWRLGSAIINQIFNQFIS